jgi:hypothetical protein
MDVGGQLHTLACLILGAQYPLDMTLGFSQPSVWLLWRRGEFLPRIKHQILVRPTSSVVTVSTELSLHQVWYVKRKCVITQGNKID